VILLALFVIVLVALFVFGYRTISAASSPQVANGVLTLVLTVGATVYLIDNFTW